MGTKLLSEINASEMSGSSFHASIEAQNSCSHPLLFSNLFERWYSSIISRVWVQDKEKKKKVSLHCFGLIHFGNPERTIGLCDERDSATLSAHTGPVRHLLLHMLGKGNATGKWLAALVVALSPTLVIVASILGLWPWEPGYGTCPVLHTPAGFQKHLNSIFYLLAYFQYFKDAMYKHL